MERMMTSDSRHKGSEINHNRGQKEKDAKAIGIQRQLSKEEYERENVEIAVQLEVLMEMLQRNEEDQKHGYVMRKKLKWQKLQEKWNHQVNIVGIMFLVWLYVTDVVLDGNTRGVIT